MPDTNLSSFIWPVADLLRGERSRALARPLARISSFAAAALFLLAPAAAAAVLYVDVGAPAAGADGSLAKPFPGIQAAVNAAANGDEIRVAAGTYGPIAVASKELRLLGGYATGFGSRSPAATPSVIAATTAVNAVDLFEVANSVVDGFAIRGGKHGVFIDADYQSTTNKPLLQNNVIEQNGIATENGGGVSAVHCVLTLAGNTIRGNIGLRGAGVASGCPGTEIRDNVIENNVAHDDHGGGLYLSGPNLVVRNNTIRGNEVGRIIGYGWGGGAIVFNEGTNALFQGNVFTDNLAASAGSGAYVDDGAVATFDHDLFHANRCPSTGGAALGVDGSGTNISSRVTMVNVTIAAHRCAGVLGNAAYVEAQSSVTLRNSIVWDNGGDDFLADATSTITATYTLSQEALAGTGNLSADPLFANAAAGDFHVRSRSGRYDPGTSAFVNDAVDSPTIDVGDPASDYALEPAPNGSRINLGHTGNTARASRSPGGAPADGGPADGGDGGTGADAGGPDAGGGAAPKSSGGGCGSAGAPAGLALAAALACLALRRRRRR